MGDSKNMEIISNTVDSGFIGGVMTAIETPVDSEDDLLENFCDSVRIPPLTRSCGAIGATKINEVDAPEDNVRVRTESSGSAASHTMPAALTQCSSFPMGHKKTRKRDKLRREIRRLTAVRSNNNKPSLKRIGL